jgi:hypothetical protein
MEFIDKVVQWLPGDQEEGEWGVNVNGHKVHLSGDRWCDGCPTTINCKCPCYHWTVCSEVVKMVNCVLHTFWYTKEIDREGNQTCKRGF